MRFSIKVKPSAKIEKVERDLFGGYSIWVKEPPKEGKANTAAIKLFAKELHTTPSRIKIISGRATRHKIFEVAE